MQDGSTTYGGFTKVIAQMEGRRDPFVMGPGEGLPPADLDVAPLKTALAGDPGACAASPTTFAYKVRELHEEFAGRPQILWLHGLLIAHLRRRTQPAQTAVLFRRLWTEEADFLLDHLDARWLVSAVTTFADHGETEAQRRVGHTLNVLFNMMKLYETERLFSPTPPDRPHDGRRQKADLPMQMDAFAISSGGLDVNLLGRIWQDAAEDPVIRPLAHHLLELLEADPATVFRRLRLMRADRAARRPPPVEDPFRLPRRKDNTNPAPVPAAPRGTPRWGTVSTIRAPLPRIARFAAHHLDAGAARVTIYLDTPDPATASWISRDPRVEVIACDAAHWDRLKGRPETHQRRQMRNATHAYRRSDLDWLAHIDVDEFILSPAPLAELLARAPATAAVVHLNPAELLAGSQRHFKLTARFAGHHKSVLTEVYPTFGAHLRGGYISHLEGKVIARTGIAEVRLGLHALLYRGEATTNRAVLRDGWIGHAHVESWQHFRDSLDFRLTRGSYRKRDAGFRLADVLDFLRESEGEAGLRAFFAEVCEDSAALRDRLARHDMLVTHDLKLGDKVAAIFGPLPGGSG
ncbi:glycosyltransferase family 2 protein [Pseudooceanicola aestuarii]|uniref:glycosyltransferase family 2 protein n=1 Tax=Pseudooceanicola aestuarii TaxID=2697319 RepID=UPI0013CFD5DE|nr:glycosyltransferase family 2 protein [Pseudooceanicola aestuarii]